MSLQLGIPFLLAVVFGAGVLVSLLPIARQGDDKWFFALRKRVMYRKPLNWSKLV
jgi:hypothetical protein